MVAIRSPSYAVDEVCLLLEFADRGVIAVLASWQGWTDLCAAIEKLHGARRFGQWHAEVISAPVGHPIDVWSRAARRQQLTAQARNAISAYCAARRRAAPV